MVYLSYVIYLDIWWHTFSKEPHFMICHVSWCVLMDDTCHIRKTSHIRVPHALGNKHAPDHQPCLQVLEELARRVLLRERRREGERECACVCACVRTCVRACVRVRLARLGYVSSLCSYCASRYGVSQSTGFIEFTRKGVLSRTYALGSRLIWMNRYTQQNAKNHEPWAALGSRQIWTNRYQTTNTKNVCLGQSLERGRAVAGARSSRQRIWLIELNR